jgi:hypothetical protein
MKIRNFLTAVLGVAVLGVTIGCTENRRAEQAPTETPVESADRADRDWTAERDEYIARRERQLDEYESRWENFQDTASAKSRAAWNEVKEESAELRAELRDLRGASKEKWEAGKRKLDNGWDRFETKVRGVFDDDDRPNR